MAQIFPTDFEEKLTMAQDDYILFSDSEDGNKIKKAQYKNLKGEKGDTGPAGKDGKDGIDGESATITVGSTSTLPSGSSATVTNSGTSSAAVLDFGIPQGPKGEDGKNGTDGKDGADGAAATITVGSTTTGNPGTSASVVNSGTSSAAVFDFTIPQGATGATGNGIASITSSKVGKITTVTITETNTNVDTFQISDGADGQGAGDVVGPASSTDGDVVLFDGVTGKLIKDGSKSLNDLVQTSGNQTIAGTKTFSTSPVVPSKTTDATNTGTAIATEAQVYNVANGLGTAASKNTGTSSGNVPVLDANGKLDTTILPGVALTDTFTVTDKSDLTSLSTAEQGDIGIVTSESKTYVLSQAPYSTLANWKELLSPTDTVTSVNSKTGAVTLDADDISDSTTTNKFVTATDKSTWSGKQDALTLPATPTQGNLVTWGADNETLVDGGAVPTGVPSGGTNGQVLTNVNGTPTWANPTGGIQEAPNSPITGIKYVWRGSEAQYAALSQYYTDVPGDTEFRTYY